MKNNFEELINKSALNKLNSTKAKNDTEKQRIELKRNILNLSNL